MRDSARDTLAGHIVKREPLAGGLDGGIYCCSDIPTSAVVQPLPLIIAKKTSHLSAKYLELFVCFSLLVHKEYSNFEIGRKKSHFSVECQNILGFSI